MLDELTARYAIIMYKYGRFQSNYKSLQINLEPAKDGPQKKTNVKNGVVTIAQKKWTSAGYIKKIYASSWVRKVLEWKLLANM